MKILVTNDDGINAPGLWALAAELANLGEVTVFAPDREQSGVGTGITLHRPVRLQQVEAKVPGLKAFQVEGTPGDSVILGLDSVGDVSLVVSGINRGANLGDDVLLSGTVGGALQGYLRGIPSIAVSVEYSGEMRFEVAAKLARLLGKRISKGPKMGMLLNVNLPNLPLDMIKGISVTTVGRGGYSSAIQMGYDGRANQYRISIGPPRWDPREGTDMYAVQNGHISISTLEGMLRDHTEVPSFLDGSLPLLVGELRS